MLPLAETRRAQGRAEGERDLVAIARQALFVEVSELRQLLDTARPGHHSALEARDIENARALTAAFVLASRTAANTANNSPQRSAAMKSPTSG